MKGKRKSLVLVLMLVCAIVATGTFSYIPAAAVGESTVFLSEDGESGESSEHGTDSGGTDNNNDENSSNNGGDGGTGASGDNNGQEGNDTDENEGTDDGDGTSPEDPAAKIGVSYWVHVQGYGNQNPVENGGVSGTSGESKRLEAISISLTGLDETDTESSIEYMTQIQGDGWENDWSAADGELSGTSGDSKRLEAIRIRLTGPIAKEYDVYYRVHCQSYGWLSWAKNEEYSGSEGLSRRLEAIQIILVEKHTVPADDVEGITSNYNNAYVSGVLYRTHVQTDGWQSYVENGKMSGTSGKSYRLEGIELKLTSDIDGGIEYRTHIQNNGWESKWASDGNLSGTSGQMKRLEAIQIMLTGTAADQFDVYYRVHCQSYGWLGWAKNGESAGSEGLAKRLEGIQVVLVEKDGAAPGIVNGINSTYPEAYVTGALYRTHVQSIGWQSYVGNGEISGTSGKSYRLEAINIKLTSDINGGIRYKTQVQDLGWETNWTTNGGLSGTSGKSKRLEAIVIELTGEAADNYNIYYRVHCQDYGWLGWARDGEPAGTEGYSKRLEAIQVKVVPKDQPAPGSTENAFRSGLEDGKKTLNLINAERTTAAIGSMEWDDALYKICKIRLTEIKTKLDNYRPNGSYFTSALKENGYDYIAAGEWVYNNGTSTTPEKALAVWKTKPKCTEQILNAKYTKAAIATDGKHWVFIGVKP